MSFGASLGGLVPWELHSRAAFAMSAGGRRSVWPGHPPTSSAEFLIQLAFAWLSRPQFLVWYLDRPEYFQYSEDAYIDENLQLMYGGFSELPGCTAVKQDGLYTLTYIYVVC